MLARGSVAERKAIREEGESRTTETNVLCAFQAVPGLWAPEDIHHILVKYGAFIIERAGTNIEQAMATLKPDEVRGVHYIRQVISNDVSSTKVRQLLKSDMSIDYLIPHEVVKYIKEHGLYQ